MKLSKNGIFLLLILLTVFISIFYYKSYFSEMIESSGFKFNKYEIIHSEILATKYPDDPPKIRNYHSSCKGLFESGSVVETCNKASKTKSCARNPAEEWKPDGCKLKYYSKPELAKCLQDYSDSYRNKLYIFGDSRQRGLYEMFRHRLTGEEIVRIKYVEDKQTHYNESNIELILRARRFPNDGLVKELTHIEAHETPIMVYLGMALHPMERYVRTNKTNGFALAEKEYIDDLHRLKPIANVLTLKTKVTWLSQYKVQEAKYFPNRTEVLERYDNDASEILKDTHLVFLHSVKQMGALTFDSYADGIHFGDKGNAILVEMLINYLCNNREDSQDPELCCSGQNKLFDA